MNELNFVIFAPEFKANVGGFIALYNLAKIISEYKVSCKIFDFQNKKVTNDVFSDYATTSDITDNTVVIYPEVIEGNPLKAKHVVRWILCELGINCESDIYRTWGKDDLIYHFSSYNPDENIEQYNLLSPLYLDPKLVNNLKPREGYCHLIRKGHKFHNQLSYIHPFDSLLLDDDLSQEILIYILNRKEYIISYDPYSYISFMAALCGCISIVVPLKDYNKDQWFKSLSISKFLSQSGENELKGIAYGLEEINYARKTLTEAHFQQQIAFSYGKETVHYFVNDLLNLFNQKSSSTFLPRNSKILRVKEIFPEISNIQYQFTKQIEKWEIEEKKITIELKNILKQLIKIHINRAFSKVKNFVIKTVNKFSNTN